LFEDWKAKALDYSNERIESWMGRRKRICHSMKLKTKLISRLDMVCLGLMLCLGLGEVLWGRSSRPLTCIESDGIEAQD